MHTLLISCPAAVHHSQLALLTYSIPDIAVRFAQIDAARWLVKTWATPATIQRRLGQLLEPNDGLRIADYEDHETLGSLNGHVRVSWRRGHLLSADDLLADTAAHRLTPRSVLRASMRGSSRST